MDGGNCLIVPPRNPDGLANAIFLLLSKPELSDRLRRNGPITASRFDWNHATDRFEAALLLSDTQIHAIQN